MFSKNKVNPESNCDYLKELGYRMKKLRPKNRDLCIQQVRLGLAGQTSASALRSQGQHQKHLFFRHLQIAGDKKPRVVHHYNKESHLFEHTQLNMLTLQEIELCNYSSK